VAEERIRIEVAYEGGQAFSALVPLQVADELEHRLANGDSGTVSIEAEDGRYIVVLRNVNYVKRFARESRLGFGVPGP
jgi:hypothetical protein